MTKDLLKVIKNNCSFGKLDHSMPRGVTCGRVTKATSVGQTRQRKEGEERKICIGVCGGSFHSNVCWFVKLQGGFRKGCPLSP